jgi:hypothetical protein
MVENFLLPAVLWNDWHYESTVDQLSLWNSQAIVCFIPDFGIFNHYSKSFPRTTYELLLKLYTQYFHSLLLEAECSLIYLSEEFLQCKTSDLLKYLIASNLSTLLTIPTTSVSVKWSFPVLKRSYIYLCSIQTQEGLDKLPLMTTENKILHDLENSSNFCLW